MVQNTFVANSHTPKNLLGMTGRDDCKNPRRWWPCSLTESSGPAVHSAVYCGLPSAVRLGQKSYAVCCPSPTMYFSLKRPIPLGNHNPFFRLLHIAKTIN